MPLRTFPISGGTRYTIPEGTSTVDFDVTAVYHTSGRTYASVMLRDAGNTVHVHERVELSSGFQREKLAERASHVNGMSSYAWTDTLLQIYSAVDADLRRTATAELSSDWADPIPFALTVGPDFPMHIFPLQIENFLDTAAHSFQVPRSFVATALLGVASAAVNAKMKVFIHSSWTVSLNEFFLICMESGERKSAVHAELFKPLRERERELFQLDGPRIAQNEAERAVLEQKVKELQSRAAKAKAGEALEAMNEAKQAASDLAQFEVERPVRLLASDFTTEALAKLLDEQHGKIAVESAEGGMFATLAGRYSGVASFDLVCQGYSGDAVVIDRKNNGRPINLQEPSIAMCISVQPHIIRSLGDTPAFRAQGLLARMKFIFPETAIGYRETNALPIPEYLTVQYSDVIRALLRIPERGPDERFLVLSQEAETLFRHFCQQSEEQLREGGDFESFRDWGNRLPASTLKTAGLLHCLELALHTHEPWGVPISEKTLEDAIAIGGFYAEHAAIAFGMIGSEGRMQDAEKVWRAIQRNGLSEFSERDAWRLLVRQFDRKSELESALSLLVDMGYVRATETPYSGRGQKPSQKYEANPKLLS